MLPNLNRLTLVPTGGMLGNAQWPEDEVCSICTFPLARPSEDERYEWPFSGDGTGFTAVACVQGHTFHKGCLRFMQRFNDTRCPDCRKPLFKEVLENVSRPDTEQLERERRQEEERERARAQRAREDREREERQQQPQQPQPSQDVVRRRIAQIRLEAMGFAPNEPGPQDPNDHFVMWTFCVKGYVLHTVVDDLRSQFYYFMTAHWRGPNSMNDWRQRLAIEQQWTGLGSALVDNGDAQQPITNMGRVLPRCGRQEA